MRERDRQHEPRTTQGDSGSSAGGGAASGDSPQERAERLLRVGNDAIRRALSNDAARFLAENQQQGGQ